MSSPHVAAVGERPGSSPGGRASRCARARIFAALKRKFAQNHSDRKSSVLSVVCILANRVKADFALIESQSLMVDHV